jgi:hypothetical protein
MEYGGEDRELGERLINNGIKFKTPEGASADPEITTIFEANLEKSPVKSESFDETHPLFKNLEIEKPYLDWVKNFIDFDAPDAEETIDKLWKYKNHHATYEGSTLHDYAENYLSNRIMPEPRVSPEGLKFEEIEETYKVMRQHFHNFYDDTVAKGKLIPVKSELVIGDRNLMLCGMVDQLFWNERHQCYQIWDWKTNTKLRMRNDYGNKMKDCLYMLDDCEFNTYSLQLGVYKKIIEDNTNIKLGESHIVWFNEENQNYKIIKCKDYSEHVDNMFEVLKTNNTILV